VGFIATRRFGVVKARFIDPDYRKRMTIEHLLAALKSAQDSEENGQQT
jgi:hypothetical protein